MIVCTFNIKNKYFEGSNKREKRICKLIDFINNEKIDVLCLQEVNVKVYNYLKDNLKGYRLLGEDRGSFKKSNEYNLIIVKKGYKIVKSKTYSLSKKINKKGSKFLFNMFPRICTVVHLKRGNNKYMVVNTHLSVLLNRKKQLMVIDKIIMDEKDGENVIFAGDLNMRFNKILKDFAFLNRLKTVISSKTIRFSKRKVIDYVFVSKDLIIKSYDVLNDIKLSDHFPIKVIVLKG